ncbi:MAG TPA: hypothetical protein VL400_13930, partial [Polyangiaceae bacterium]|nr:hypothetical protein [Polyangiaceae bacterium]
ILCFGALGLSAALAMSCGDDGTTSSGATTTTSGSGGAGGGGTGGAATTTSTGGAGGGTGGAGGGAGGCVDSLPVLTTVPDNLSETGLYSDIATDTVAPYIRAYQPEYPLWSDGAEKARWAYLPECAGPIDTTDMDFWSMPVGARFWKQFTRDGVRIETRMIARTGPGDMDFKFAAYVWDLAGTDAVHTTDGVVDANGTGHDVPPESLCSGCHKKEWRILGFSAIQLTHADSGIPGESMASLSAEGKLSTPLPGGVTIPGTAEEKAALGYLHANCGGCHHEGGIPNISMKLKVLSTATTVQETDTWLTAVNQPTTMFLCADGTHCDRVEPDDPDHSAIVQRISVRAGMTNPPFPGTQMPPFATEIVDQTGVDAVRAWIQAIPP